MELAMYAFQQMETRTHLLVQCPLAAEGWHKLKLTQVVIGVDSLETLVTKLIGNN